MADATSDASAMEDTQMEDAPAAKPDTGSTPRQRPPKLGPRPMNSTVPDRVQETKAAETKLIEVESIVNDLRYHLSDTQAKVKRAEDIARDSVRSLQESQENAKHFQEAHIHIRKDFDKLKYRYDKLYNGHEISYKTITDQLQASHANETRLEDIAANSQLRAKELAEELKKCKDELFSLQPPSQVPDTQIISQWDTLCSNIVQWVDDQAGELGRLSSQLKELRDDDQFSDLIAHYWAEDRQELAIHFPNILDDLLRYNVHYLLEKTVFAPSVYMAGLTAHESEVLSTVEKAMLALEPRKDRISIDAWKSEALNALVSTSGYPSSLKEFARSTTRQAVEAFEPLLPKRAKGAMQTFHREITEPAVKLACTLRKSSASYDFVFIATPKVYQTQRPDLLPPEKAGLLFAADLDRSEILDIETRKTLKPNRLEPNKDGSIGNRIMIIHPALYRRRGDEKILLGKQLLLAQLPEASQHRGKPRNNEGSKNLIAGLFNRS